MLLTDVFDVGVGVHSLKLLLMMLLLLLPVMILLM
jgi:hypothetical protein